MASDQAELPSLIAVYPAPEVDTLHAELSVEIERLEQLLEEAELSAAAAEGRLVGLEPVDTEVAERVVVRTERVLGLMAADLEREVDELLLDARRLAAQRVGEAASEAEKRIEETRVVVARALSSAPAAPAAPSPAATPLAPPAPAAWPSDLPAAAPADAVTPSAPEPAVHDDEFWREEQAARSWVRRLPLALLAQLLGLLVVIVLILVRVG